MNAQTFFGRFRSSAITRLAGVELVGLAWSSLAFSDEIHEAARTGKIDTVKALLKDRPDSISSKDKDGRTLLHWAAINGHRDVAELLLASKADARRFRRAGPNKS
jgi:Ankyrin repeats (3 copies)